MEIQILVFFIFTLKIAGFGTKSDKITKVRRVSALQRSKFRSVDRPANYCPLIRWVFSVRKRPVSPNERTDRILASPVCRPDITHRTKSCIFHLKQHIVSHLSPPSNDWRWHALPSGLDGCSCPAFAVTRGEVWELRNKKKNRTVRGRSPGKRNVPSVGPLLFSENRCGACESITKRRTCFFRRIAACLAFCFILIFRWYLWTSTSSILLKTPELPAEPKLSGQSSLCY